MKRFLTFVVPVLLCGVVNAQLAFQSYYGTANQEGCNSVVPTPDGGYIMAGSSRINSNDDVVMIKLDSLGSIVWSKTYSTSNAEYGMVAKPTSDGGYILAGLTSLNGVDILVMKTDALGNLSWSKTFGGSGQENIYDIQQTTDGGYLVSAEARSFGTQGAWLIKIDSIGNTTWSKVYCGNLWSYQCNAKQTSDGGYILAAQIVDSTTSFVQEIMLVKTDANGDTAWTKVFGGNNIEEVSSVIQTADGGYAVAGRTYSFGAGLSDFFLTRTDATGDLMWTKVYGGPNAEVWARVLEINSKGFMIAGWTASFGGTINDFYMIRTNEYGDTIWTSVYGEPGANFNYSLCRTHDGGYIMGGEEYPTPPGDYDMCVVKTDSIGYSPCFSFGTNTIVTQATMSVFNLDVNIHNGGSGQNISLLTGNSPCIQTSICSNVSVPEQEDLSNTFTVFPNPASSVISIVIPTQYHDATVTLFNSLGQPVREIDHIAGTTVPVPCNGLSEGVYYVMIVADNGEIRSKPFLISPSAQ